MNTRKNAFIMAAGSSAVVPLSISVEAKGKVAFIVIAGHISDWGKASSTAVLKDIREAKAAGAKAAKLYVNTQGGNVIEANEIRNLIDSNFKTITVEIGALCASAGTIFPSSYKATCKPNSQFMIHKPMMGVGGNEDEIEARLKLLKNLTAEYKAMYAKKFGKTEDEIDALWVKGDYWMDAKEALKIGLVDAIEGEEEKIDANTRLQLVACGAPFIPVAKTPKPQEQEQTPINRMELSVLAVQLGLPSDATQAQVDAKLKEINEKAARVDAVEKADADKKAAEKATKIKALLDQGEKDKKFAPAVRATYQAIGENSIENLEAVLKNAPSIEAISQQITPGGTGAAEVSAEDRSKWTFQDYQEKNPEAFLKLSETDPEKAESLAEAHYN